MAENFGGPVWHASGCGRTERDSKRICLDGLRGVGDADLLQHVFAGESPGVIHVIRRLTDAEREAYAVPEPYDIRGTDEEGRRIAAVFAEAPHLRGRF